MTKEQIYDERIAPLMTQVIGICREAGIAMVASFALPTPENADLMCTSVLPDGEGKGHVLAPFALRVARGEQPGPSGMVVLTIEKGGKT